jgi:hypothetical protein
MIMIGHGVLDCFVLKKKRSVATISSARIRDAQIPQQQRNTPPGSQPRILGLGAALPRHTKPGKPES